MTRSASALGAGLDALATRRVLCVGDLILDVEVACGAGRLSPEAPVLVFAEREHLHRPGGAANVAANLAALGASVTLAGVLGYDPEGEALAGQMRGLGIETVTSIGDEEARPTTRKTRFVADGQQLLRIDRETTRPIGQSSVESLMDRIEQAGARFDVILVSDYGKGVVTGRLMERCLALAARCGAKLLVDPKGDAWDRYGPVDCIKPNARELAAFTGFPCDTDMEIERALQAALDNCGTEAMLVTRAGHGASLIRRDMHGVQHFRARPVEVADVCGAGDTNLAALGGMLAAGLILEDAIEIAQLASGLAVQRHGTAVVSASELLEASVATERQTGTRGKCLGGEALYALLRVWRWLGLRVGFTNGCFDLFHPGQIDTLETARQACDRLVVGLNSDASVRRLKGATRPVVGERDRARVLAGLSAVDAVVLFDEDTPESLIARIRPDVLVKGGDYDPATLAGGALVESYGGRVFVTDLLPGRSTSRILGAIERQAGAPIPSLPFHPGDYHAS